VYVLMVVRLMDVVLFTVNGSKTCHVFHDDYMVTPKHVRK
jgi:hypothetical protein